jgi:hypothetical protein
MPGGELFRRDERGNRLAMKLGFVRFCFHRSVSPVALAWRL